MTGCRQAIEMAMSRFQQIEALEAEVGSLKERLEVRKLVERAKGLLMEAQQWSEPQAFRWIQKTSMDLRKGMREVAQLVIDEHAATKDPDS